VRTQYAACEAASATRPRSVHQKAAPALGMAVRRMSRATMPAGSLRPAIVKPG
jgi:hypothetical protein